MFERFTDRARRVLVLAQEEARLLGHDHIGTEHLLLGLVHEAEGVAATALASVGVELDAARAKVEEYAPRGRRDPGSPPFSPRAKEALEMSLREAAALGHNYIGTEHLLLGLVREGGGLVARTLVELGAAPERVRQAVIDLIAGYGGSLTAVEGASVEKTDVPVGAGALLGSAEAAAIIGGWLQVDQRVEHTDLDGVVYETYTYSPAGLPPDISVAVVGARVEREALDRYTARIPDAERVDGLGDAATFSPQRRTLRVLTASTVFVVRVGRHHDPRAAAIEVARVALTNLTGDI